MGTTARGLKGIRRDLLAVQKQFHAVLVQHGAERRERGWRSAFLEGRSEFHATPCGVTRREERESGERGGGPSGSRDPEFHVTPCGVTRREEREPGGRQAFRRAATSIPRHALRRDAERRERVRCRRPGLRQSRGGRVRAPRRTRSTPNDAALVAPRGASTPAESRWALCEAILDASEIRFGACRFRGKPRQQLLQLGSARGMRIAPQRRPAVHGRALRRDPDGMHRRRKRPAIIQQPGERAAVTAERWTIERDAQHDAAVLAAPHQGAAKSRQGGGGAGERDPAPRQVAAQLLACARSRNEHSELRRDLRRHGVRHAKTPVQSTCQQPIGRMPFAPLARREYRHVGALAALRANPACCRTAALHPA